LQDDI
jgi:hypothetical protein